MRWLLILFLGVVVGVGLAAPAYFYGKQRGAGEEKERALARENAILLPAVHKAPIQRPVEGVEPAGAEDKKTAPADAGSGAMSAPAKGIQLAAMDCVRLSWPMEITPTDDTHSQPRLRLREGANRFAKPDHGIAEFCFWMHNDATLYLVLHALGLDECSNSIIARIDGGPLNIVDFGNTYSQWQWVYARRSWRLKRGLHRLTLMACEDGVEIDNLVLSTQRWRPDKLDQMVKDLPHRKPPAFTTLPVASVTLPAIGPFTAEAFPLASRVIAPGHSNRMGVYLRLNGSEDLAGTVRVRMGRGKDLARKSFTLSREKRSELVVLDLPLERRRNVMVPVGVYVESGGKVLHAQRVDFISPLDWAFLGPFLDPKKEGLDLGLLTPAQFAEIHKRPPVAGATWRVVTDGSCYNELGVIDLNKVFGLGNKPRISAAAKAPKPMVAYAVTCVPQFMGHPHQSLVYGADDGLRTWLNGHEILRAENQGPLELSRQMVATRTRKGRNVFAFKVFQTESYWQLLFEPAWETPYGMRDFLMRLDVKQW